MMRLQVDIDYKLGRHVFFGMFFSLEANEQDGILFIFVYRYVFNII